MKNETQFADHLLSTSPDLAALDDWCKRRAARISERAAQHLNGGRSLNAPNYRTMLGEHRAYMAMRSYIHGSLKRDREV